MHYACDTERIIHTELNYFNAVIFGAGPLVTAPSKLRVGF